MKRTQEVLDMLKNGSISSFDTLTFIEADLSDAAKGSDAARDCTYVLHVASPILLALPKDEKVCHRIINQKLWLKELPGIYCSRHEYWL